MTGRSQDDGDKDLMIMIRYILEVNCVIRIRMYRDILGVNVLPAMERFLYNSTVWTSPRIQQVVANASAQCHWQ